MIQVKKDRSLRLWLLHIPPAPVLESRKAYNLIMTYLAQLFCAAAISRMILSIDSETTIWLLIGLEKGVRGRSKPDTTVIQDSIQNVVSPKSLRVWKTA